MTKYINFSVAETRGRTFEIPYDEAIELINKIKKEDKWVADIDIEDEDDIAKFFCDYDLDQIHEYELDNDYFETIVTDTEIGEY